MNRNRDMTIEGLGLNFSVASGVCLSVFRLYFVIPNCVFSTTVIVLPDKTLNVNVPYISMALIQVPFGALERVFLL